MKCSESVSYQAKSNAFLEYLFSFFIVKFVIERYHAAKLAEILDKCNIGEINGDDLVTGDTLYAKCMSVFWRISSILQRMVKCIVMFVYFLAFQGICIAFVCIHKVMMENIFVHNKNKKYFFSFSHFLSLAIPKKIF